MDKMQLLCKKVLLMPIICDKKNEKITLSDNVILTGQKYCKSADEDMSDFAISFYEIIYRDLMDKMGLKKLLSGSGCLCFEELAGDTMNSFNTVANKTSGAGISKKQRKPEDEWPDYLKLYKRKYHCLANFWLLPMEVGRTLKGNLNKAVSPVNDYMDNFLKEVHSQIRFNDSERCYYRYFEDWDNYIDKHFIRNAYLNNEGEIAMYSDLNSEDFTIHALCRINKRAEDIAKSKYTSKLIELFSELGIV